MDKKFIMISLVTTIMLLGVACETNGPGGTPDPVDPSLNNGGVIEDSVDLEGAKEAVSWYLRYSLGSISDSILNFDIAREYLTPDLEEQSHDDMFWPMSYCIQQGPDEVRIVSAEYDEEHNWVIVSVEGKYWEDWQLMWDFQVVEVEGDRWMINEIQCKG